MTTDDTPEHAAAADTRLTITVWDAPDATNVQYIHGNEVRFWAVVHDERGGVGWLAGSALLQP